MKRFSKADAIKLGESILAIKNRTYLDVRKVCRDFGLEPTTQILAEAFPIMATISEWTYSPNDKGRNGKHREVKKRLHEKIKAGAQFTYWSEFYAHKQGQVDIIGADDGLHYESKTGAGNFNYCRYSTLEQMRAYYEQKESARLDWKYEAIGVHVVCTWGEFFQYLEAYNKKGLETWYKKERILTSKGYVFQLQNITGSDKKIKYLQNWELNKYKK